MKRYSRTGGVTLIELLVTITVLAILLTLAIPSFTNLIATNRATAEASLLANAFNYARSEAVRRGQNVYVTSANTNNGTDWTQGWSVWAQASGNPGQVFQAGDTALQNQGPFNGTATLTGDSGYLGFVSSGALIRPPVVFSGSDNTGVNNELQFQLAVPGNASANKTIFVNLIGRVSIQ